MRRAVLGVLGVLILASPAWADWRSLKSDHFLVIGDATDRDLRDVALRLEQFRDVIGRRSPSVLRDDDSPPVVVLVFRSRRSFEPLMPKSNGRTVQSAGYFQAGQGVNYIAMTTENGDDPMPTILHEFAHLLLRGITKDAPVWFSEGLAEYYSTFDVVQGGRRANIGKLIEQHVLLLRERRLPFAAFFAIGHDSPEYTKETIDRAVLYAQSWAIVHHAFHSDSKRLDQLFGFVQRISNGTDTATAFRQSYDIDVKALEREVQLYVQRQNYEYSSVDFDDLLATQITAPITPISDAAAEAWLGDLLAQQGRSQEARARAERALAADPGIALAHATLGTLKLRENSTAEARAHLEKAIALGSANEFAHYAYAYAVLSSGPVEADQAAAAARALERAIALRPGYTEAKLLLAYAYLTTNRADAARDLLAPLVKADPTNHQAALRLAEALLRLNELDAARSLLGPVFARSTDQTERERARELLGTLVGLQRRRETLAAAGAAASAAAAPASPASASPATTSPDAARVLYTFRPTEQGEQRVYGVFEAIECSQGQFVVVVRTAEGAVRARAARFEDIQFVTYRKLASQQVSCGKQNPAYEIYLTWRQGVPPATERTAVAVEVLPEGFIPQ